MTIFITLTAVRYIFRSGNALESAHGFPAYNYGLMIKKLAC